MVYTSAIYKNKVEGDPFGILVININLYLIQTKLFMNHLMALVGRNSYNLLDKILSCIEYIK